MFPNNFFDNQCPNIMNEDFESFDYNKVNPAVFVRHDRLWRW